ncbi:late transcription unit protein LtuB [Chlamydia ibidis]|nr:late transcription unit protein LtuB [Chlamydia ibidis]
MAKARKKRDDRALAKVIERKSKELLRKSRKIKKSKFRLSKEETQLRSRAEQYDRIVHSILDKNTSNPDKILIFSYKDGFIFTDICDFGKYSVKL